MKSVHIFVVSIALTISLSACARDDRHTSVFQHISVGSDEVSVHSRSAADDARITARGDLMIGKQTIILNTAQRESTRNYYAEVMALRSGGIATGKAGAAMAGSAIGTVAQELANGTPDAIGPKVEHEADKVRAQASNICLRLEALKRAQDAVTAAVPAFAPYATIEENEISSCKV